MSRLIESAEAISIHAPRVGSDLHRITAGLVDLAISIHAPRVGSDEIVLASSTSGSTFQSTLPVWGATYQTRAYENFERDFNPRSPCGERPGMVGNPVFVQKISIHAPRVGSDVYCRYPHKQTRGFQSTLPVWGATSRPSKMRRRPRHFNPRSPCGERHLCCLYYNINHRNFNPRSPCGERHPHPAKSKQKERFQSTLPVWGATDLATFAYLAAFISIHAPRVGSDDKTSL